MYVYLLEEHTWNELLTIRPGTYRTIYSTLSNKTDMRESKKKELGAEFTYL